MLTADQKLQKLQNFGIVLTSVVITILEFLTIYFDQGFCLDFEVPQGLTSFIYLALITRFGLLLVYAVDKLAGLRLNPSVYIYIYGTGAGLAFIEAAILQAYYKPSGGYVQERMWVF
jgi:hypothetical protein